MIIQKRPTEVKIGGEEIMEVSVLSVRRKPVT